MNEMTPFNFEGNQHYDLNCKKKGVTIRDEIMQNNNVY